MALFINMAALTSSTSPYFQRSSGDTLVSLLSTSLPTYIWLLCNFNPRHFVQTIGYTRGVIVLTNSFRSYCDTTEHIKCDDSLLGKWTFNQMYHTCIGFKSHRAPDYLYKLRVFGIILLSAFIYKNFFLQFFYNSLLTVSNMLC